MVDPTPDPDTGNETPPGPDLDSADGTPLWVKVFGIVALVFIVLLVVLLLTGGHGPGRHTMPAAPGHQLPAPGS